MCVTAQANGTHNDIQQTQQWAHEDALCLAQPGNARQHAVVDSIPHSAARPRDPSTTARTSGEACGPGRKTSTPTPTRGSPGYMRDDPPPPPGAVLDALQAPPPGQPRGWGPRLRGELRPGIRGCCCCCVGPGAWGQWVRPPHTAPRRRAAAPRKLAAPMWTIRDRLGLSRRARRGSVGVSPMRSPPHTAALLFSAYTAVQISDSALRRPPC